MSFDALESSTAGGRPYELYKFTSGTRAWYITSGDTVRTHMGQTYAPDTIDRDDIELNQETTSGTIEVRLPLSSELAKEFIPYLPPEPMWLTIFAGHDGDSDVIVRRKGRVVDAKFGDVCKLTVAPQTVAVRKKIPPAVYQQSCNRIHYSPACGAGTLGNSWSAKIGSIDGLEITVDLAASESALYNAAWEFYWPREEAEYPRLAYGYMVSPDGRRMMISRHIDLGVFEIKAPVPGLAVGDVVQVFRGCRRTFDHCKFYSRTGQFLGFDIMPQKNPFQGVL